MPAKKSHCLRGHELTEANSYHPPKAPHKSLCRECIALRNAARERRHPKPCIDCGAETATAIGTRPSSRCGECRAERRRAQTAAKMRRLRAEGYRPPVGERLWTREQRDRFWARVSFGEACWEWQGLRTRGGYGIFDLMGTRLGAHRAAWEMTHGPIPDRLMIRHDCDNRRCVRPDHLRTGTHKDNVRDAVERGRYRSGDDHWTRRGSAT